MTSNELRSAILDLYENRATMPTHELHAWHRLLDTTAYFLKQEYDKRDVKFIDQCIEGSAAV